MTESEVKELNRQKRGQVSEIEITRHQDAGDDELRRMLESDDAKQRTIAATVIGNQAIVAMIPLLGAGLTKEQSLYSRIAISEALGKIGKAAVMPLIALLGKVGANQETELPTKYFDKKSYPLARDMAARTLVKIGAPAIDGLIERIESGDGFETQQAIDALGGIVSKTNDQRALSVLLGVLTGYSANEITVWKIVRALTPSKPWERLDRC
jgi:HEAT repeat protein